ncbi:hypothetical protein Tco_0653697 [Tanacetum coccineum]|uniref:Uncharacterized protein n=1 Tax=Tanacetum coccineum TaxID=301880 RepID=A0ABQ4X1I8_9ASTR
MSKLPKIKNSRRSRSRSPSPGGSVNASGTGKDSPVSINDKDKVEKRSFTKEMKEHCWKMAKRRSGRAIGRNRDWIIGYYGNVKTDSKSTLPEFERILLIHNTIKSLALAIFRCGKPELQFQDHVADENAYSTIPYRKLIKIATKLTIEIKYKSSFSEKGGTNKLSIGIVPEDSDIFLCKLKSKTRRKSKLVNRKEAYQNQMNKETKGKNLDNRTLILQESRSCIQTTTLDFSSTESKLKLRATSKNRATASLYADVITQPPPSISHINRPSTLTQSRQLPYLSSFQVTHHFHQYLSDIEKAQVAADDMAIQLVFLGSQNDVFVTVDALESAYEIQQPSPIPQQQQQQHLNPQPLMNNNENFFTDNQMFIPDTANMNSADSINHMMAFLAKAFQRYYTTPTNNNQIISSNPSIRAAGQSYGNPNSHN